jgi:cell wall-associated NlpC family hydrolase
VKRPAAAGAPPDRGDARESPGPIRESALSVRTSRAIVAGAAVLSITLPTVSAEGHPTSTPPPAAASSPAFVVSGLPASPAIAAVFGPIAPAPAARAELGDRPAPAGSPVKRKARPALERTLAERAERPASRAAARSTVRKVRNVRKVTGLRTRPVVRKVTRKAPGARRGMAAVVAFAQSKVGAAYGRGAGRYDCSKLVASAYAAAGYRLPSQSGAIARRTRTVSWAAARPGDVIVGRGHVGIYMGKRKGRHMMIDAGNSGTGVVYRPVYRNSQGLHPERLG